MSLSMNGIDTSIVKVTNISSHGFWLLIHGEELFLSYESFPWFKNRSIRDITNVIEESPGHVYWPDLDIDLTYESILTPEKFPLKSKII